MSTSLNEYYKDKTVLITGNTGFKGTWLSYMLDRLGANVIGYSLKPPTNPSLYELSGIDKKITTISGDVRDLSTMMNVFKKYQPDIVLHLAAQPLVRESYVSPVYTYDTNVMGTVNILECVRKTDCVKSFLNVTTDKVYLNKEWEWGYRENDCLDGFDPYSNSKSCSELVTRTYRDSFFKEKDIPISTARAGNVIGGGDFAKDRIIPDCIRAIEKGEKIVIRNPNSTRPYQHVLEPLFGYLLIVKEQELKHSLQGAYNIGPDDKDCVTTEKLVKLVCEQWGEGADYEIKKENNAPHEANFLKLDCSKIKKVFKWKPKWDINQTVEKTVEWSKQYISRESINNIMDSQIDQYVYR